MKIVIEVQPLKKIKRLASNRINRMKAERIYKTLGYGNCMSRSQYNTNLAEKAHAITDGADRDISHEHLMALVEGYVDIRANTYVY